MGNGFTSKTWVTYKFFVTLYKLRLADMNMLHKLSISPRYIRNFENR